MLKSSFLLETTNQSPLTKLKPSSNQSKIHKSILSHQRTLKKGQQGMFLIFLLGFAGKWSFGINLDIREKQKTDNDVLVARD